METRLKSRKASEKAPLPGERQGTSGATAGGCSMRAGGDQELNRRALVGTPEELHAEECSVPSPPLNAATATDASQRINLLFPETTAAGKPRTRMKWNLEVNAFIMREYYLITKMETDVTAYRSKLHKRFLTRFPESKVSEQRIADQRRTIVRKNLLSTPILNGIKEEVKMLLQPRKEQTSNDDDREATFVESLNHANIDQEVSEGGDEEEDEETWRIRHEFNTALMEFEGTNPTCRYIIPKQNCSRKLARAVQILNETVLKQHLQGKKSFEDVHTAIYCAAVAASRYNGAKLHSQTATMSGPKGARRMPPWERRLVNRIESIRSDIGRLTQFRRGNGTEKLKSKIHGILKRSKQHSVRDPSNITITEHIDTLRQKLSALSKRLRRYRECTSRKHQNTSFVTNQKGFYRNLSKTKKSEDKRHNPKMPTKELVEGFWRSVWSRATTYNLDAAWIQLEEERCQGIAEMNPPVVSIDLVRSALVKAHNWKAPGSDGLHN